VQELRRPVLRKLRRKIEYSLNKALEQCEVAWNLAYEQADSKSMLKAIEMQAKLSKLLREDVAHRHGLLDDASTEVLLEMKKEIEVRREKQKKLQEIRIEKMENVSETPHAPSLESQVGSHPGSCSFTPGS